MKLIIFALDGYMFYQMRDNMLVCITHSVAYANGYNKQTYIKNDTLLVTHNINPALLLKKYCEMFNESFDHVNVLNPYNVQ